LLVDGGEGWGFRRSSAELHRLVFVAVLTAWQFL
jgi:hypothetical protein